MTRPKIFNLLLLIFALSISSLAQSQDWRLPSGYYVPAKMPMVLVHPRPDGETHAWARHRKAYPDGTAQYRIPIAVQGGAYPFRFELISGPSGMAVGELWTDNNYGIVTWTPSSASGPYTVSVRVTDQELNTVTATWTVTATTEGFAFIDPSVAQSGDGTKASPLKTFADLHKNSRTDTTYSGYILYLRHGTHTLSGPEETNGNLRLESNRKPAVLLGYTGEIVTVDAHQAKILTASQHDLFISNIKFYNANNDVSNAHFFWITGGADRATFFEVDFDTIARGTSGTDNPSAIFLSDPGSFRQYFTLWGNSHRNYSSPMITWYSQRYAVVENNILHEGDASWTAGQGLYAKSATQYFSFRRNVSLLKAFGYGALELHMGQRSHGVSTQIEFCYNKIWTPASGPGSDAGIVYNWTTGTWPEENRPYVYIYRNTVVGRLRGLTNSGVYTVYFDNNVVLNSSDPVIPASQSAMTSIANNNLTGTRTSGILDGNYNLTDAYAQYRGTHGHEILAGQNNESAVLDKPLNLRVLSQ